ncbi:hypothetical protein BN439_pEA290036 (plasmid) [Erwinia amylovora Ea644]|nr:hypothetical protein BN439_pEA290036 [Erwinia amylovora Ea644]CCP05061.1 hypothetical protein BN440_pEA290034 [Erwinia amylovora MR1]
MNAMPCHPYFEHISGFKIIKIFIFLNVFSLDKAAKYRHITASLTPGRNNAEGVKRVFIWT